MQGRVQEVGDGKLEVAVGRRGGELARVPEHVAEPRQRRPLGDGGPRLYGARARATEVHDQAVLRPAVGLALTIVANFEIEPPKK